MNGEYNHWLGAIKARFADRDDVGKEKVYESYFADLPKIDVLQCLDLIEEEYSLPAGMLRPNDDLDLLLKPIATRNPWRWLVYQACAGDRQNEINFQLGKRQEKYGTREQWAIAGVKTVADLINAWCGRLPSNAR
jgi:hypothetical protein